MKFKKMKRISVFISLTIIQLSFSQSIDFNLIEYNGLKFNSSKSKITKKLGAPEKVYDPNYDCGFLSTDAQNRGFFTLDYGKIKFTGNEKDLYLLEYIDLENDDSIVVKYGNQSLTYKTSLSELIEVFGVKLEEKLKGNQILIFNKKGDDGIIIKIKNEKLIGFEYWSPC